MLLQLAQALDQIRALPSYNAEMMFTTPGLVVFTAHQPVETLRSQVTEALLAQGLEGTEVSSGPSPLGSRLELMISEIRTPESEPPSSTP